MKLIDGGIRVQARLALRHVDRILQAMQPPVSGDSSSNLCNVCLAICYVTQREFIAPAKKELAIYWTQCVTDDSSCRIDQCLQEYVVIPNLPREALVEWQTVALHRAEDKADEVTTETVTYRSDRSTAECTCTLRKSSTDSVDVNFICRTSTDFN